MLTAVFSGVGENRTLVQTSYLKAFYTLSLHLVFVVQPAENYLLHT